MPTWLAGLSPSTSRSPATRSPTARTTTDSTLPGRRPGDPAPLVRRFAEQAVGRITSWSDISWPRDGSRVWRAGGVRGGTWFVKVHQSDRFHDREVAAYRTWVPTLGGAVPRLVAADPGLRAIVVTAVPGRPLHGAVHPPEEQRRIFRAIGALAAAIHRCALGSLTPVTAAAALGKLEGYLAAARGRLAPGDEELVRALAKQAERLPR
ncbi:phosphotransferase [Kitasatospora aburaviensis]